MASMQKPGNGVKNFLASQQARYPAFFAIGLYVVVQLLAHDTGIYYDIASGKSDISAASQLYFPSLSLGENQGIGTSVFISMLALIGYAIAIRVSQKKL